MKRNETGTDLTGGPIVSRILLLAVPFLGSSLIQAMYSMVDSVFIGQFIGTEASASASAGSNITLILTTLFYGLASGVGVACAKAFGAKDDYWLGEIIHTVLLFTVAAGVVLTAGTELLSEQLLMLLNTPSEILAEADSYLRIYLLSVSATIIFDTANGILGALGDSASALKYQIVGSILNIALDALFAVVLGTGINGIAAASVISQAAAAVLILLKTARLPEAYAFRLKRLHMNRNALSEVLKVGIPSAVESGLISFSHTVIQAQINTLGTVSIAAFSAYCQAENFVYYPIGAIGSSSINFIGQNLGAGKKERLRKGERTAVIMAVAAGMFSSVICILLRSRIFGLFTTDQEVLELGCRMALRAFPFYCIYGFIEIFSGILRGQGLSVPPMAVTLAFMGAGRVAVLFFIMSVWPDAVSAVTVYPLSWAMTAASLGLACRICRKKGSLI